MLVIEMPAQASDPLGKEKFDLYEVAPAQREVYMISLDSVLQGETDILVNLHQRIVSPFVGLQGLQPMSTSMEDIETSNSRISFGSQI